MALGKDKLRTRYEPKSKEQVTEEVGPLTEIPEGIRCKSQILLRCRYTVDGGNLYHTFNKAVQDCIVNTLKNTTLNEFEKTKSLYWALY